MAGWKCCRNQELQTRAADQSRSRHQGRVALGQSSATHTPNASLGPRLLGTMAQNQNGTFFFP